MVKLAETASPVAREIYRRMQALGLTPKGLADRAGVAHTYVRDLIIGKSRNPRQEHLSRIATALQCSVIDLIRPSGAGQPPQGEFVQDPIELGILRLWRALNPAGRRRFLEQGLANAPTPDGEV